MRNTVKLLRYGGGDESHAEAAWASTGGMTDEKRLRMPGLLMHLGTSVPRHTVPFEHSWIQFQVTSDIATHIQFLKHRTLSINSESARYKELKNDESYMPEDWEDSTKDPTVPGTYLEDHSRTSYRLYHEAIYRLEHDGYSRKRAKESARYFLPYAHQITYIVSGNFHAYCNFWMLRNSEHAQLEIRELAQEMLLAVREETKGNFRYSLEAWGL
jgi:thymidylate synthase (FAD)